MGKKVKVLETSLYKDFKCIGSDCPATCCRGWVIHIDKDSFTKYKTSKDKEIKELAESTLVRNKKLDANDNRYALIKLDENKLCQFCDSKGLCKIQCSMGPDALSEVCATYPRKLRKLSDGTYEASVDASCPVVARMLLEGKEPIKFILDDTDEDKFKKILKSNSNFNYTEKTVEIVYMIKRAAIDFMCDKKYTITERLMVLGIYTDKIAKVLEGNQKTVNPNLVGDINKITEIMKSENFKDTFKNINIKREGQIGICNSIFARVIIRDGEKQSILKAGCGLGFDMDIKDRTPEVILEKYESAINECYLPFEKEYEQFLENFLVNKMFIESFPFNISGIDYKKIMNEYRRLAITFIVFRNIVMGNLKAYNNKMPKEKLEELVYEFDRSLEHGSLKNLILELLEENDIATLAHILILLKM